MPSQEFMVQRDMSPLTIFSLQMQPPNFTQVLAAILYKLFCDSNHINKLSIFTALSQVPLVQAG